MSGDLVSKYEVLALLQERRAVRSKLPPTTNTKQVKWLHSRVSGALASVVAVSRGSVVFHGMLGLVQVLGYLKAYGVVQHETEASIQQLLDSLPAGKLTKEDKLQLCDLRPTDQVGLEAVRSRCTCPCRLARR